MVKSIEYIDATWASKWLGEGHNKNFYLDKRFEFFLDTTDVEQHIRLGQPYRLTESRILIVQGGKAVFRISFVDYSISEGDFLFLPANVIIEKESMSDDFAVQLLAIVDMPGVSRETVDRLLPYETLRLSLGAEDRQRIEGYMVMIANQLNREHVVGESVSHLVLSMMADVDDLRRELEQRQTVRHQSRGEEVFACFLALLRQYGMTERGIPFYAGRLAITPNHLSAVVRLQSGLSVKDWLNRATVMEAKALLNYSALTIKEIADRLHFPEQTAFNRYFKKQTGMTPLEYREGYESSH